MTRPPEYYATWNLAVEAVELYLASDPRELNQDDILSICAVVFATMCDAMKYQDETNIDPKSIRWQAAVGLTCRGL